jgi:tetratricopeptide (TPR) repeat protein
MQEKATQLAPDDHRAMGRLADALRLDGGQEDRVAETYGAALGLAEALLQVNDRDWRTLGQMAVYEARLGEIAEANATLSRALQLSERKAETLYYQALVQIIEGRRDEALDNLEEAVEKDPDYRNLISIDPDFQVLWDSPRYQELISAG